MEKMKIDIWSDIACPYCYIGKRKLEEALAQFPHKDEVELVWHSYQLDNTLSKGKSDVPYYTYLQGHLGLSAAEVKERAKSVLSLAKSVGLNYDYENLVVTNTSDALRFVKLASKYNQADQAEELLFKAHFVDAKCISDRAFLIDLGLQLGVPQKEVEQMLDTDVFLGEITEDMIYSEKELNLQYIPFYLFNNKEIIQGSIDMASYLEVLNKSYADWKKNGISNEKGDTISGQSCSIGGVCS